MNTPIRRIREKREDILVILVTAIFFALAINFLTSYLIGATNQPFLLSIACFLGGIFVMARIVFSESEHVVRLRGAIAFEAVSEGVKPVKIIGYPFNDDFCRYLKGFIQENEAYAKLFSETDDKTVSSNNFNPDKLDRNSIINSVLEYVVLCELDLHLNSYFIENEIDKKRIITLGREQLGAEVLRNRVIDLITKDMKERPAFVRSSNPESEGIVVYSQGANGAIFHRLDIELPPKSTIVRNSSGYLVISNRLFDLHIVPAYRGFSTALNPIYFPSHKRPYAPMLAEVKLCMRIKRAAFFTQDAMEMYEWLDSFVDRMTDYISTERLEQRLNPDLIEILKTSAKQQ